MLWNKEKKNSNTVPAVKRYGRKNSSSITSDHCN